MQTIAFVRVLRRYLAVRKAATPSQITTTAEADEGLQDQKNPGKQPKRQRGISPGWRGRADAKANRRAECDQNRGHRARDERAGDNGSPLQCPPIKGRRSLRQTSIFNGFDR